ncbi:MAG: alpha/beta hydrolase, partial [Pseudomonadota bacterium]|nr:alpha/beta hydrolase [Pseudomonadota bacterium]
IDDAMALWDHVQQNAESLNIDPARVAVAGDSAGGLISANMCHLLKARGGVQPAVQLLAYPWVSTDVTETGSMASCADTFPLTRETMDFFNTCVFPDGKMMDHALANPTDNPDLSGLPPAIVATAGFDPIRDQGNAYAEKLKAAGNQVTHYCFGALTHSFLSFGGVTRVAEQACEQLARDLSTHLNTR